MTRTYPMIATYFPDSAGGIELATAIETAAKERGLSASILMSKMAAACLPAIANKKNEGKARISATISIDMLPPPRGARSRKIPTTKSMKSQQSAREMIKKLLKEMDEELGPVRQ